MQTSRRVRIAALNCAAGVVPLLLALTLPAFSSHDAAPETPQQVADTLDSIVQPRFQRNAGRFGVDRVMGGQVNGHDQIEWADPRSRFETRQFAVVKASHRSYVIAFLHCIHKPGAHVDPPTPVVPLDRNFRPHTDALLTVGATQTGAENNFTWANKALDPVVLPSLHQLKSGQPAQAEYENWVIVMRPVRALHQACLDCHAGAKRGDTLGVMVYAVDKNAKIKSRSFTWDGGGE